MLDDHAPDSPDAPTDPGGTAVGVPPVPDPTAPEFFVNRELSWVDFDRRVLELAQDPTTRLLERAKFAAIFASNLDEFFMIRVAGLHAKVWAENRRRGADGRTADQVLDELRAKLDPLVQEHARTVDRDILPALREHGIRIARHDELTPDQQAVVKTRFENRIYPVLTPLAVGLGRPFPYISNLSLNLGVLVRDPDTRQTVFARIKLPTEVVDRLEEVASPDATVSEEGTPIPADERVFVPLEEIVEAHLDQLFPGMEILDRGMFRVTRDADFEISDDADDVKRALEAELRNRRFGEIVRVELDARVSEALRTEIVEQLGVEERQVYDLPGLLDLTALWQLVKVPGHNELLDDPWRAVTHPRLREGDDQTADVFAAMRRGPVLVHHPYDSFHTSVERFLDQAAADKDVLAIKMTVYRTNADSTLLPALVRASEKGKQTVALVELKARFDEQANIKWARVLEDTGVHVVYGHPALKTHAKVILVVRREGEKVRHYLHIGTGNYHAKTANLYTDFGIFTRDQVLGQDVADLFNQLTGFAKPGRFRKALVAPNSLRDGLLEQIDRTVEAHRAGQETRIQLKMNALVDRASIHALYRASQAGVPIDINVRGICCLRVGVPGLSETIRVRSVLGRFLEHSRIYAFQRGEERIALMGSADIMERNLDNRVELVIPVDDESARDELLDALDRAFHDEDGSWELGADDDWHRVRPQDPENPRGLQRGLMELHAARAKEADQE
ncbi:polyphosphate kinase 1 [Patulibacter sp.]|uniref:polyphosphate kinase 1 n=1 Tax=Patulibacter sp. TaxID=1912859 RepID=UPI00271DE00A|nr:polyphosphate kinase 1 [Patulibacter sp.]MDO9409851.1 polyphosphate kinase 1 [Patulibacter sp.]